MLEADFCFTIYLSMEKKLNYVGQQPTFPPSKYKMQLDQDKPSLARNSAASDSYIVAVCGGMCLCSPLPSDDSDSRVLLPSLPKLLRTLVSVPLTFVELSECEARAFNWPPRSSAVSTESHLQLMFQN